MEWFLLVFPLWVFLISAYILIDTFQVRSVAAYVASGRGGNLCGPADSSELHSE